MKRQQLYAAVAGALLLPAGIIGFALGWPFSFAHLATGALLLAASAFAEETISRWANRGAGILYLLLGIMLFSVSWGAIHIAFGALLIAAELQK